MVAEASDVEHIPGEVTNLLGLLRLGDPQAEERLIPLVYGELRRLAASYLRKERSDHTLQPTALVHEAYLRLRDVRGIDWQSRAHFFALAAQLMRRILVDHARAHRASKRGGSREPVALDDALVFSPPRAEQFVALDEALTRLAKRDRRQSQIVEMRFFGGLDEQEIASLLGISTRTVKRDWRIAKAWLFRELNPKPKGPSDQSQAKSCER
jgi:RNA polymerase sigma factor (TIGR02999 family)